MCSVLNVIVSLRSNNIGMVITYHGDNYFKLQAGELIVLVDPTNLRSVKGADVVLSTSKPADITPSEETVFIDHQGEYEVKHIQIRGWSAGSGETGGERKEKTFYMLELDEIKVAILGPLSHEPDPKTLIPLKGAQILILPAGGKPFMSETAAARIARQIEPSIVIPSSYKDIKPFLKEFKKASAEVEEKLVIKAKDLKPGVLQIKCLKP